MTAARSEAREDRVHPLLYVALAVGLLFHGVLLVMGSYTHTFDAWIHIFFADHYARSWFDNWEPRWYTGFTVTSYPPGTHMMIALVSILVGLQMGFVVVQLSAIALLTVGIYRFSRIWVDPRAAGMAALLGVLGTSIAETVHVFGQLPTTFSLAFLLNTLPFVRDWLVSGRRFALLLSVIGLAATTACHHVTTLFGSVFFAGPVIVMVAVEAFRTPIPGEPEGSLAMMGMRDLPRLAARRLRRVLPVGVRTLIFGIGAGMALILTVLAYWLWSSSDPIRQIPIPHASRDSYIANPDAGLVFFVIPWGLSILALPYVVTRVFKPRVWPLALSVLLLWFLGTGGTTPFPKMLLAGAYDILTLDRFTFWATIAILPFAGEFVLWLFVGDGAKFLREQLGPGAVTVMRVGLVAAAIALTIFSASLSSFRPMQPAPIDPAPIADFMSKDQHWRYRYLTLGFGDQMAWISANTTALTVDGNYHSARRLPQLTRTSVERLDGAKFRGLSGLGSLQQILAVPERYRLKYVFANDRFYEPLLAFMGWHQIGRLENGVVVWERADIPPLPDTLPARRIPMWQRLMWGILPMAAILSAITLFAIVFFRSRGGRRLALEVGGSVARLGWPFSILDRWLARSSVIEDAGPRAFRPWQVWGLWAQRLPRPGRPSVRARTVRAIALLVALALLGVLVVRPMLAHQSAKDVVEAYYDALDLHRFDDAWALLDPDTRPTYASYRLGVSIKGGLLGSSYAKLSDLTVDVTPTDATHAVAVADTTWLTAMETYDRSERLALVQRNGRWAIVLPDEPAPEPSSIVEVRPEVQWYRQGRRTVSDGGIAWADMLDRPSLALVSARMVSGPDGDAVVGEVMNTSTLPADLTVNAKVRADGGLELESGNAATAVVHTLLPGERTPFRIDLEDANAAPPAKVTIIEFDPEGRSRKPVALDRIGILQVDAHAVVTDLDAHADLGVDGVRVTAEPDGCHVAASVRALGTEAISVPQLLVTAYDADGQPRWVQDAYLPYALRPGRTGDIVVTLPDLVQVQVRNVPQGLSVNGLDVDGTDVAAAAAAGALPADAVPAPAGCHAAWIAVTPNGFRAQP
ncbi:MAG: hypothetical protein U0869_20650 [Chloroflexota bacterium]